MALPMLANSKATTRPQTTTSDTEPSFSARSRRSWVGGGSGPGRCAFTFSTNAITADTAAARSSTVDRWKPWMDGALSNHGTPRLETNQYAFGPVAASAATTSSPARNAARLRLERSTVELVASAVSAAMAEPTAANAPKWCVHLVGV